MTAQQAFDLAIKTYGKALIAVDGDTDITGVNPTSFGGGKLDHPIVAVRRSTVVDWQRQVNLFAEHGVRKSASTKAMTLAGADWHVWEVAKVKERL